MKEFQRDTKKERNYGKGHHERKTVVFSVFVVGFVVFVVLLVLLGESMGEWDKDGCWEVKHAVGKGWGVFLSSSSSSSSKVILICCVLSCLLSFSKNSFEKGWEREVGLGRKTCCCCSG